MKNYLSIRESNTSLQHAAAVITGFIETAAIYCFAAKNHADCSNNVFSNKEENKKDTNHFFLLILTEETKINATADLSDLIAGAIPNCQVTLLLHKTMSLRNLTSSQKWFFNTIMTSENKISKNTEDKLSINTDNESCKNTDKVITNTYPTPFLHLDKEPVRIVKLAEIYWENRLKIAQTYRESEQQIETSGMECVQHSMQHVAVEQICLGLIEVFLGYHPNHYALNYLFSLCSIFTTLTDDLFPQNTEEDRLLYKFLTTNFHTLRHAKTNYHGFTYTELLSKRCAEFLEKSQIIVAEKMLELNNLKTTE